MLTSPWSIKGEIATLRRGRFAAELQLNMPQRGLHKVFIDDIAVVDAAASLIGVYTQPLDRPETIQDAYVRGDDLVVTYAETAERNVRLQIYWRAFDFPENAPQGFGVDLIVSTQTSLLHSDPTTFVESRLPRESEQLVVAAVPAGDLILQRLSQAPWTFVQMVHPSDFVSAEVSRSPEGDGFVRHRLFAPGLEKGVIRRARLRGIFLPTRSDEELARAAFAALSVQELPLTT